jgi:hypothetical protein
VLVDDRIQHLIGDIAGQRDELGGIFRRQYPVDRHGCNS